MAAVAYDNRSRNTYFRERPIQPRRSALRVVTSPSEQVRRPLRLSTATYRRRRLGIALLATMALLVVGLMLGRLGAGPLASPETALHGSSGSLIALHEHVVASGDTDWSIARSMQKDGDIRPLVAYIAQQHAGHALQVGQVIELP